MVYDTFLLYNELELLEIRLNELDSVVDKFVIVEATVTHTNQPKPLYYKENKSRFKKFHKKIIHIVVSDSPDVYMTWVIERHQLSAVTRGLVDCKPNDTIMYSCVDEIPKPEKIIEWKDKPGLNKVFRMSLHLYFLNYIRTNGDIEATRMFRYKDLARFKDIYLTRYMKADVVIKDGGWHFTYMGGIKRVQEKLSSFAHQELNNNNYNTREKITRSIIERKDPFGFKWKFRVADITLLPKYVQENPAKFKDMILDKNSPLLRYSRFSLISLDIRHFLRVKILRKIKLLIST